MPRLDPLKYTGYSLATVDEVIDGSSNNTIVTPYALQQALDYGIDVNFDDLTVNGQFRLTSVAANTVLLGGGANPVTGVGPGTNGQLLIGSTGSAPAWASLSVSNGLTATAGAGSLALQITNWSQGSWTPVLTAATTPPNSVTYSAQIGRYLRIDNALFIYGCVSISAFTLGAGLGPLWISGLPFNVPVSLTASRVNISLDNFGYTPGLPAGFLGMKASLSTSANHIFLALERLGAAVTQVLIQDTTIGAGTNISFNGVGFLS